MLWVVENLQEELFRSQEYRLKAEKRQQEHRGTIDGLQVAILNRECHEPKKIMQRKS